MTLRDQIAIGNCVSLSQVKRVCKQRGIREIEAIRHFEEIQKKWNDGENPNQPKPSESDDDEETSL